MTGVFQNIIYLDKQLQINIVGQMLKLRWVVSCFKCLEQINLNRHGNVSNTPKQLQDTLTNWVYSRDGQMYCFSDPYSRTAGTLADHCYRQRTL